MPPRRARRPPLSGRTVPQVGRGAPRRVVLVVYPGAQILDVTGPAAVFTTVNRCTGRGEYAVEIVSASGKPTPTSGAVTIETRAAHATSTRGIHTLLVVGGDDGAVRAALRERVLSDWFRRAASRATRYGSVCGGAFLLASYGLLGGRRAATHWDGCALLKELFPSVDVDAEALYVVDGPVWTSAGVTAGIDMALAMVEKDVGRAVAGAVAQRLVVYARRPGHQSQFSALLQAQVRSDAPYGELIEWMHANLGSELDVESLARRARQSPRDFHRKFTRVTGETPARFVENLRLEQARVLLSHAMGLKEIADRTGFGSAVRMSRAFERRFGVKPSMFRQMLPTVA
jgi:transcriptional regulator GlxA family with amidase domain